MLTPIILLLVIQVKLIGGLCQIGSQRARCKTLNDIRMDWDSIVYASTPEITIGEDQNLYTTQQHLNLILTEDMLCCNDYLENINIYYQLEDIKKNAFLSNHLSGLVRINLRYNNLVILRSESFVGLTLRELLLTNNNIEIIEPETFQRTRVQYLALSNNKVSVLFKNHLPKDLVKLLLDFNLLFYVQQSTLSPSLLYLNMNNNHFKDIAHCGLDNLTKLEILLLSHNQLTKITKFPALPKLTNLDLSFNKLQYIEPTAFVNVQQITELILTFNEIKSINFLYGKLPNVRSLLLQYNFLMDISLKKISKTLKHINIHGNPLSCTCLVTEEKYIESNNISQVTIEDTEYFKIGSKPICISFKISPDGYSSNQQRFQHFELETLEKRFVQIVRNY